MWGDSKTCKDVFLLLNLSTCILATTLAIRFDFLYVGFLKTWSLKDTMKEDFFGLTPKKTLQSLEDCKEVMFVSRFAIFKWLFKWLLIKGNNSYGYYYCKIKGWFLCCFCYCQQHNWRWRLVVCILALQQGRLLFVFKFFGNKNQLQIRFLLSLNQSLAESCCS